MVIIKDMEAPVKRLVVLAIVVIAVSAINIQPGLAEVNASKIFKKKCATCHALKKRKFGPAVSLMSKDPNVLKYDIENGRRGMPKFGNKLSAAEIDAMVSFIQSSQAE